MPPLLMKVPLAAVELPEKDVEPPKFSEHPLPLLVKVPLPAFEVPEKLVKPGPPKPQSPPKLVKVVRLPAVASLLNDINPWLSPKVPAEKLCTFPELFVIPTPPTEKKRLLAMVYALAPGSNTMPLTSTMEAPTEMPVILDTSNVA